MNNKSFINDNKFYIITTIMLAGFVAATAFHYISGYYLNSGYPYNTFLFRTTDHFNDFFQVYDITNNFNSAKSNNIAYFPFSHLILTLITIIPKIPAFLIVSTLFILTIALQNYYYFVDIVKNNKAKFQAFIISFLSYPFLFILDRGNIEVLIYIFIALFFYSYYIKRSFIASIIFLSMAIGMKIYAATLIILLISDKKFKESIYTLLTTITLIFSGYALMAYTSGKGLFDVIRIGQQSTQAFIDLYVIKMGGLNHGHSIWGIISIVRLSIIKSLNLNIALGIYTKCVILIFILISIYIIFIEKEDWRKITLIIFSMILMPYISNDYTLIHIYFPIIFFIRSKGLNNRLDKFYSISFGLLLIPLNYYYFDYADIPYVGTDVSISVIIYPIVMMFVMVAIIIEGLKRKTSDYLH